MDYDFMEKIYRDYYDRVKMVVINVIYSNNTDDITSCVQDVFLTAMQKNGLENHPHIDGWLYITAKNITMRFNEKYLYRMKKNTPIEDFDRPKEDFSEQLIEEISYNQLGEEIIENIIGSLSKTEQDFYRLKYKEGFDNKKISELLSITVGAVITRNSRIKARVKQLLKDELYKNDLI